MPKKGHGKSRDGKAKSKKSASKRDEKGAAPIEASGEAEQSVDATPIVSSDGSAESVSLDHDTMAALEARARLERRTNSELIREALHLYLRSD